MVVDIDIDLSGLHASRGGQMERSAEAPELGRLPAERRQRLVLRPARHPEEDRHLPGNVRQVAAGTVNTRIGCAPIIGIN